MNMDILPTKTQKIIEMICQNFMSFPYNLWIKLGKPFERKKKKDSR